MLVRVFAAVQQNNRTSMGAGVGFYLCSSFIYAVVVILFLFWGVPFGDPKTRFGVVKGWDTPFVSLLI